MFENPDIAIFNNNCKRAYEEYNQGNIENSIYFYRQAQKALKSLITSVQIDANLRDHYTNEYNKIDKWIASVEGNKSAPQQATKAKSKDSSSKDSMDAPYGHVVRQWFETEIPDVSMEDVAGLEELKKEIMTNIIAPINYPEIYSLYRKDRSARILMAGAPGVGKTFVVKAISNKLKFPVAIVSAKDILSGLVGDAEKNLGDLFEQADEYENCIIFFDEIDSLCASRDSDESRHTKSVLTTLLTMMDGFNSKKGNKIILAATNRPWAIDSALMRGGRFDTKIYIPLPDKAARLAIVSSALNKGVWVPRENDNIVDIIADKLEGFGGGDITAICRHISSKPLGRAIGKRLNGGDNGVTEKITLADVDEVISNYNNPITPEMIKEFEDFMKKPS